MRALRIIWKRIAGGYEAVDTLQGGFASLAPAGATSGDKSWVRLCTNLTFVVFEKAETYTAGVRLLCHLRAFPHIIWYVNISRAWF